MAIPITTVEEALAAVKQDGRALYNVPMKLRTLELCLEAVKHGDALAYVPENIRTVELCHEAIKRIIEIYVPGALRDEVLRALKSGA